MNLLIYDAINQLLLKSKINAPKLIKENYDKNYIEIEDLGNETILSTLKKKKIKLKFLKKFFYYLLEFKKLTKKKL